MHVLIVGAGPTGTALAFLLARNGIEVTLLEKETGFGRLFRGEALMPSGVDAIRQMGLHDEFVRLPQKRDECMEFFVDGSRVVRADWPEIAGPNAVHVVSQPALLEMLTAAAAKYSTFDLRLGATVRAVRVSRDRVELQVDASEGPKTVEGDFVIGADGRASVVRACAGLKVERLPFPFDVLWFSLPLPPDQHDDPRFQAFSRGNALVVWYPSWNGQLRLGLNLPTLPQGRSALTKNELLEEAVRIAGETNASFIRTYAEEATEPESLKVLVGRCAKWTAPRLLLLGDAAHPMSPVRAQGINLALRDAIVAANHLVPVLKDSDATEFAQAAVTIQSEREPEIIESQRLQLATAQPPAPARFAFLRMTILPILHRLGIVKRLFLRAEVPLRHGVVPVQLTV